LQSAAQFPVLAESRPQRLVSTLQVFDLEAAQARRRVEEQRGYVSPKLAAGRVTRS